MEVTYTLENGITVKLEGKTQTDIWDQLAEFQEVFDNTVCTVKIEGTVYTSDKVRFCKRTVEDNDYYELMCVDRETAGGRLYGFKKAFGQHKKGGTLFPKWDIPEGNYIPGLNGWHKYVKPKDGQESAPAKTSSKSTENDNVPF